MPRHHHSSIIRGALKECSRACAPDGCDQERSLYCLQMAQGNLDKALALLADRTAQADASSGKWCRRSDTCLTEAVMARLDPTNIIDGFSKRYGLKRLVYYARIRQITQ